jgi:spore maturation protein CgeB
LKILCALGEHNYGRRERGRGYEYSNFLPAWRSLGHEVAFFETLDRSGYTDFAHLNRLFLARVQQEKPDILFCVLMHYELWMETLELARQASGALLINWATDDSWKYRSFSRLIAPHFDLYATTYAKAQQQALQDGLGNFFLTQWAASGSTLQEPLAARDCSHRVSFIGSRYGDRAQWIEGLRARGIAVDCFGQGWERGPVTAEEIPKIMRESVISLNFGDSGRVMEGLRFARSRQIKARIFEVPGYGGFLLTQPAEGLERYYVPDRELATFNDLEELTRKIHCYLARPDDRDRIARAGHDRTRAEHTYERRFSELLAAAEALPGRGRAAAPVPAAEAFARLADRHRSHAGLRLLRRLLTAPCALLWGGQRGKRAARRILFELSWRLCGETTYSASGWPGRIFYRES